MTEVGKSIIPGSQIPASTLYKRTLDSFLAEYPDENIADLHLGHHQKRRIKNLLRLNTLLKMRGTADDPQQMTSMPTLPGTAVIRNHVNSTLEMVPGAINYATNTATTRNITKKNSALMHGLA